MIISSRLKLVNFTQQHAEAMAKGDNEFSVFINAGLPKYWSEEKIEIETFYNEVKNNVENNIDWGGYLIIHKDDNKLIGSCGFKGNPKDDGSVEIGYEIHNDYRGMGFAQEAAKALTEFAFTFPGVIKVLAHTLAEENVSCNVLRKSGFSFVKQYNDPEDGEIWQWEFMR